jgi:hypothetical protein
MKQALSQRWIWILALAALGATSCASGGLADDGGAGANSGNNDGRPSGPLDNGGECPDDACALGEVLCVGGGEVFECIPFEDGCPAFSLAQTCEAGQRCVEGACVSDEDCQDGDGDGRGPSCGLGEDCDDDDPDRFEGSAELCDGVDNDCDGAIDEDACEVECARFVCSPDERRCNGPSELQACEPTADGCGVWAESVPCDGLCEDGRCADDACVDLDGDGHGRGCALGEDCDDRDPERFDGATDLCDGVDNDCDGSSDEDYGDLGDPCEAGQGACEVTGRVICSPDGFSTRCDAQPRAPQAELCGDNLDNDCDGQIDDGFEREGDSCGEGAGQCQVIGTFACSPDRRSLVCDGQPIFADDEVCDQQDNDCDGQIDEGNVCNVCNDADDPNEPNNNSSSGTNLARGASDEGKICGNNVPADRSNWDWFRLGSYNAGQNITVEVEVTQPANPGAMRVHLEIYNPNYVDASVRSGDTASLTVRAPTTGNYAVTVLVDNAPAGGVSYIIRHR